MIWELVVDRVVVHGAPSRELRTTELRAAIERAVAETLATRALPTGRAVHAVIEVHAPRLTSGAAVAGAVAQGVSRAMSRRASGG